MRKPALAKRCPCCGTVIPAANAPPFSEWLRKTIGPNWVIARRTQRILFQYGDDVVTLSPKQFETLKERYRRLFGCDPYP